MAPVNNNTIDIFGRQRTRANDGCARGLPGTGFKLTTSGDYDIQGKRLTKVSDPRSVKDATNKQYVDLKIHELRQLFANLINKDVMITMRKIAQEQRSSDLTEEVKKLIHEQTHEDRRKCLIMFTNLQKDIMELKKNIK
ncbi:MAG: hypothetical protein KTM48_02850 [Wolbachia endosymbiont of Pissodes strobi]|nr:hypothetical protein [Wolbachia endosymbiont of Pissodes strobi]